MPLGERSLLGISLMGMGLSLPGCGHSPVPPPPAPLESRAGLAAPNPADITEIRVERRSGPALPDGSNVRLSRSAAGAYEFDRLARWLVDHGFFALEDRYGGPEPYDGESVVITVVYGDREKVVVNHASRGDDQTWPFEMIIRGASAAIARHRKAP